MDLGLALDAVQLDQFTRYCTELLQVNRHTNLTAIRNADAVMTRLFLQSLAILSVLPESFGDLERDLRVIDVGSGAGIPGIPLKIARPAWHVTLIESTGKKAAFIQGVINNLHLQPAEVLAERVEVTGRKEAYRDSAGLCVARAVAPLPVLLEWCAPLVAPGGLLAFPKSAPINDELEAAVNAAEALQCGLEGVHPLPDPTGDGRAGVVVLYRKLAATPAAYPRRIGLATVRPIGDLPAPRPVRGKRSRPE